MVSETVQDLSYIVTFYIANLSLFSLLNSIFSVWITQLEKCVVSVCPLRCACHNRCVCVCVREPITPDVVFNSI